MAEEKKEDDNAPSTEEDDKTSHISTLTTSENLKEWSYWGQNMDDRFCFCACSMISKGTINRLSNNNDIYTITDFDLLTNNNTNVANYSHIMNQANRRVNKLLTLFDSQSTVDVICNKAMLKNVHQINTHLKIFSTGGMVTTNWVKKLPAYRYGWFHKEGIANILLLVP